MLPSVATGMLGGSGGVVNSVDFYSTSLKSLGFFYFRCVPSSQWKAVTVKSNVYMDAKKLILSMHLRSSGWRKMMQSHFFFLYIFLSSHHLFPAILVNAMALAFCTAPQF